MTRDSSSPCNNTANTTMSGGRHSNDDIPFNPYSSQPWAAGQRTQSQQYLNPDDLYRSHESYASPGQLYQTSSYQTSRHSSESYSPNHSTSSTAAYQQPLYTQVAPSYRQRQSYDSSSRHVSTSSASYSKRQSGSNLDSDNRSQQYSQSAYSTQRQSQGSQKRHSDDAGRRKDKGKQVDDKRDDRRGQISGRHEEHRPAEGRKYGPSLPPGEKLVNGVFVRY